MRRGRIGMAVVAAVAAALGLSTTASAAPSSDPNPVAPYIIDGSDAQNAPWAARLFSNDRGVCSATVIAPTWVLTAEHCVAGGGAISFGIGSLDQTQGERVAATRVIVNDTADLALAELERSVDVPFSPLGTADAVAVGQTVQTYGWGATCTDQSEANCQSQLLKVANVNVTSVSCGDYRGGTAVCASRGDGIPAGGDSGGPMFATSPVDGSYYQVGVASTSDRATFTAYTNVTQYRDWIAGIAGV